MNGDGIAVEKRLHVIVVAMILQHGIIHSRFVLSNPGNQIGVSWQQRIGRNQAKGFRE